MKLGEVAHHEPPLKRIDLTHIGRPRIITREQIENGVYREPCAEAYQQEYLTGTWTLKDNAP